MTLESAIEDCKENIELLRMLNSRVASINDLLSGMDSVNGSLKESPDRHAQPGMLGGLKILQSELREQLINLGNRLGQVEQSLSPSMEVATPSSRKEPWASSLERGIAGTMGQPNANR